MLKDTKIGRVCISPVVRDIFAKTFSCDAPNYIFAFIIADLRIEGGMRRNRGRENWASKGKMFWGSGKGSNLRKYVTIITMNIIKARESGGSQEKTGWIVFYCSGWDSFVLQRAAGRFGLSESVNISTILR